MRIVHLTDADLMPEVEVDALEGRYPDARHYDRAIRHHSLVLKPNGQPLGLYLPNVLDLPVCRAVFDVFKDIPLASKNRGTASGGPTLRPTRRDGTQSSTAQARTVPSGVLGFLDRTPRYPCRMSALTITNFAAYEVAQPFLEEVDRLFSLHMTDRWAAQRGFVERVPDFSITETAFTTVTVNRSWRTAAHLDQNDYRQGFGVMAAMGNFDGGELVFPKYRTAFDLRTGGVLLADVHELHGNAPLEVRPGHQRLSFVFYARERMNECGSKAEELTHAQERDFEDEEITE
jgi:hypothetical protein